MATTTIPDPASLKGWEEAFQYPLPTVRKLSIRLRKDIDEHRSRLRSLVGTSYRDLLGTAERIIEMDQQIQSVESGLSDIGRRCNSNILERSDANYTKLERAWLQQGSGEQKLRITAQCKILAAALSAVSRLIRSGGSPLQAAKIMILTRLLYKSLSEVEHVPAVLERYRRMIAALRVKLLAYIDRKLGREDTSTDELIGALSSYTLLTSSTLKEVLKHLLAVRMAQLEILGGRQTTDSILAALNLYTATFVSVQAVFPKRLAEALSTLSKTTLLSDKHVKSIEELNLDIYGRWIAEDVRTFTPWVHQESISAQDGRQAILGYSAEARDILLQGLKRCLAGTSSTEAVLDVRKKVLGASLSVGTRIKMDSFQEQLEEFREVFMERLEELIHTTTAVPEDFDPAHISDTGSTKTSIWDLAQNQLDLSSGGMNFRKAVLRQLNGRDASLDRVIAPFDTWRLRVEGLWSNVEAMQATKWDEHLETDFDDDDDDDVVPPYQDMLSKEDAARMRKQLHASVRQAITDVFERLKQAIRRSSDQSQFYLRLIRELHKQQLELVQTIGLQDVQSLARHDLSRELHVHLAKTIAGHGSDALSTAYQRQHFVPLELWEGTPKLPLQPLPATFRFVMTIQQEMAKVGEDVWSAAAVAVLKDAIQSRLKDVLALEIAVSDGYIDAKMSTNGSDALDEQQTTEVKTNDARQATEVKTNDDIEVGADGAAEAKVNDDTDAEEPNGNPTQVNGENTGETAVLGTSDDSPPSIDLSLDNIQRLFDGLYLARVFSTSESSSKLEPALNALKDRAALAADGNDIHRLERYVAEYCKKTYLLFGLLANSSRSYSR